MMNTKYRSSCTILSLLLITLTVMAASCGSPAQVSDEGTGAITVHAIWEGAVPSFQPSGHISMAAPAGVVNVRMTVSGTGMTSMSQTFAAGLGTGTIGGVPAGSGRTLTLQGLDGSSNVIYQGTVSNLTVVANTTTNAGTVTLLPVQLRTIGGTISGLAGTLILQNNGGDNLTLTANGIFTFSSSIQNGTTYSVTVLQQPSGQTCSVANGAGTAAANVTNITVLCTAGNFTIGGTISGLAGSVTLQNNNADNYTLTLNGSFTFAAPVAQGATYNVTVQSQPSGQICSVSNGSGTATANVTNISVICSATNYSIGGTISGLAGTVVLQNNNADNLTIPTSGIFGFVMHVALGAPYNVTVLTQPAGQTCTVTNGSGTANADVTNISVTCTNNAAGADTWQATSTTSAPAGRFAHAAVWTGSEMIIWGGNSGTRLNTGGRYDPVTDSWGTPPTTTGAPAARDHTTAVWTGNAMIIWGGQDSAGTALNTGGIYTPATDSWNTVKPTSAGAPTARNAHIAVWTGSEMIIWGGSVGSTKFNDGMRYNPLTDTWASMTTAGAPSARDLHAAVWSGTEMIVWGGYTSAGVRLGDGGRYNPVTNTWGTAPTTSGAPSARFGSSAVWTGKEMIVWGGNDGVDVNTGKRYDPSTNLWSTATATIGAPVARSRHSAVWTGIQMIIWGGTPTGTPQNTGGRYSPYGTVSLIHDSWQAISATGAPSARRGVRAVWTGSEMIVWGGFDGTNFVNTGGRYDPFTDSWKTPPTLTGAPAIRMHHSAIWTGSEMIIWGGQNFSNFWLDTGGRYNPATDSWGAATSASGTPRREHSAVWTGSEMIVWGGIDSSGNKSNTGGRYNPTINTWGTPPNTAGAPTARNEHAAVWTGTEMIIWGGNDSTALNTGGRYNPSTNTWGTAPTTLSAPTARALVSAVWTGAEMIIWGGADSTALNTGGRYNPSTNTWGTAPTTAGAPAARQEHTAVWTGSQMFIWGGTVAGDNVLNTGGRYAP